MLKTIKQKKIFTLHTGICTVTERPTPKCMTSSTCIGMLSKNELAMIDYKGWNI